MGDMQPSDHAGSSSVLVGVLVILLLLTFFSLAFYAIPKYWRHHHHGKSLPTLSVTRRSKERQAVIDPSSLSSSANLYDFYTELKKPHGSSPLLKTQATPSAGQFALQLAVFSDKKSAHRLIDRLAIQGYQASIIKYKQGLRYMYRVLLGPYVSVEASQRDQQHLGKLHVDFIVVPYQQSGQSTT